MFTKEYTLIALTTVMMFVTATGIVADEDAPKVVISPKRQAFYAGGPFSVDVWSTLTSTRINYRLQFANRTASRGTFTVEKAGTTQVNLEFPELKQGVVVAAELTCFTDDIDVSKTLYMFSRKAVIDGIGEIAYWHTGEKSELKNVLKESGADVVNCDDLSRATTPTIVVQDMNLDDAPGIIYELSNLCLAGKKVVLLNPTGTLPWATSAEKMVLEAPIFTTKLDKRFDVLPMTASLVAGELDGEPALKVQPGTKGFCICRIQIGKGELIILTCQFKEMVLENPTPLYVIKSLLTQKETTNE